ncbi:MAG: signal peptidase I [bacterium]
MHYKRNSNLVSQKHLGSKKQGAAENVRKDKKKKNLAREYTEAILVALLAALFLRAFVVQAFRIPTGSMKDTLLVGDFLLVNKFIYGVRTPDHIPMINAQIPYGRLPAFKDPTNGDVVVFKYPKNPELDYIKRCIAVGGQTVEIRDGTVYVDGKPEGEKIDLGREYDPDEGRFVEYFRINAPNGKSYVIRHYADHYLKSEDFGPVTVPEDHYFMMGDNRDNSADSRVWGFLPHDNVVGEALIIYFSWNKHGHLIDLVRWSRIANLIK